MCPNHFLPLPVLFPLPRIPFHPPHTSPITWLTLIFFIFYFLVTPRGMQDLSSPTRGRISAPLQWKLDHQEIPTLAYVLRLNSDVTSFKKLSLGYPYSLFPG